ncbi:hypothetical protein PF005_g28065 [Phytophthora fragariae]|nr:hypothetical protein PF003_g3039 [Phytophthora fragariae]KAE8933179.1 hypothetical protein PF009_g16807 [Phytophthora fragariae]KAE8991471.1 hypothetical protein PF011_g17938 [Phytophthora fragariae]KAE9099481.1 hypothetical protein PF007_g15858 [Phytophthora fragariae]KAE9099629.1 hypothetical protein PF010_g15122 [Phytophthora fragariae]
MLLSVAVSAPCILSCSNFRASSCNARLCVIFMCMYPTTNNKCGLRKVYIILSLASNSGNRGEER